MRALGRTLRGREGKELTIWYGMMWVSSGRGDDGGQLFHGGVLPWSSSSFLLFVSSSVGTDTVALPTMNRSNIWDNMQCSTFISTDSWRVQEHNLLSEYLISDKHLWTFLCFWAQQYVVSFPSFALFETLRYFFENFGWILQPCFTCSSLDFIFRMNKNRIKSTLNL